ncbi:unnamed protein product, partial [Pylaiella littoralis]
PQNNSRGSSCGGNYDGTASTRRLKETGESARQDNYPTGWMQNLPYSPPRAHNNNHLLLFSLLLHLRHHLHVNHGLRSAQHQQASPTGKSLQRKQKQRQQQQQFGIQRENRPSNALRCLAAQQSSVNNL